MKTLVLAALRCSLIFLVPTVTYAISAQFNHSSTGHASFVSSNDRILNFFDHSSLDGGGDFVDSTLNFFNHSTAGGNIFLGSSYMNFHNRSSAGTGEIQAYFGSVTFFDHSTAGSAYLGITADSILGFGGRSSAGNAFIGAGDAGQIYFYESSTAGNATINSCGYLWFGGSSKGGTAQIEIGDIPELNYSGMLDISGHDAPGLTIGSLADAGSSPGAVFLGANDLTVGSNNLSTAFSGVIQDGTEFGGGSGSLTKIGTGTFTLTGANTYTGNTNVNRGVLQVDGSITSNTFVNRRGTLAGTGTINSNVANNGRVSPGSAGSPGMLTVTGNYTQAQYATLMIQLAGASPDQFSVLNILGNANLNGFLDPVLLNGFVPAVGDSFTFLNYASFTGAFSQILSQVFNHGTEQWSVIYQNNNAILTVESHTPAVPDHGSTFLLLMLGLLGLVAFRRQLIRGQT